MREQEIYDLVEAKLDEAIEGVDHYIETRTKYSLKMASLQVALRSTKRTCAYDLANPNAR